jgi:phosphatidylglycerophosphatase A
MTSKGIIKPAPGGFFTKMLSSFFFIGYLPKAPGTWASGVTAVILFFIWPREWYLQIPPIFLIFAIGVWISGRAEEYFGHDGGQIVIDEVAGQMTALFMAPKLIIPFILGFLLFRLFDIIKPPPAGYWESLRGGWGVMSDDIGAGMYAAVSLNFLLALLNLWGVTLI